MGHGQSTSRCVKAYSWGIQATKIQFQVVRSPSLAMEWTFAFR